MLLYRAYTFLTIGRRLARVAATVADRVPESTPEERSEIARHLAASYRIVRDAAARRGALPDFPGLSLGPATPRDSPAQRMARLQNGTRQFSHTFRRYRRRLNGAERQRVLSQVRDLDRIAAQIAARTRAQRG